MKSKKGIMNLPLLLMGVFLVFAISCDELDDYLGQENVPVLSTAEVTEITANSATSGGNIADDGETTLITRGVCWSTNENPTIEDNKTEDGTGAGSFTSSISDLEPNTTYYLRAYATSSAGTGYGSAMSFTTEEGSSVPVLSTAEVTDITANSAISGGNITDDGETTLTARGVCWSTNENPTIEDNKTEDGTGVGSFTSSISDLEPNTTYYLRAYATNSAGTGYGSAMSFTTEGEEWSESTFTDPRDDKVYKTVTNGSQEWMAENLAYAPSNGNYWVYDNDDANVEVYGYLYDWETALNVCPTGWHLPSDEEWTELTDYLGGSSSVAGGKLKATGTIEAGTGFWRDPNTGATNETGFTALPGGLRGSSSCGWAFGHIGSKGYWWSATKYDFDNAWLRTMVFNYTSVSRNNYLKEHGFSVRCLRD